MYNLIIKNATVIDGTGKPGEILDMAVQGDEIVNIDKKIDTHAQTVIDASGKILAPGFVDLQNHSDSYWQIFDNPSLDSLITQGYTTILLGNCGASLAPLLSNEALKSMQKWHNLEATNINWTSFSEYIEELSRHRLACNVATLVGYSTLRRAIVADQIRSLDKPETAALQNALRESLEAGAFGLSNGLSYAHEIIISELELFELAKIIKKYNGLFSVHLRSEGSEIVEALDEALDIAKNTEVNLKISHLKIRNEINWHKFPEVTGLLDTAYHQGVNVNFDVYPYETIWQALYSYLPKWAMEGGREIMLRHFADPVQKNKILMHLNNINVKFPQVMVASTANKLNFTGKTIGQIAKNLEVSSEQAVLDLIQNGGSEVLVFEKNLDEQQVSQLLVHPLSFIGTDGAGFAEKSTSGRLVHPRCFGTAPKFLRESVDKGVLTIEAAVQKLTSGPAKKLGLKKRGELKIGNFADLVIFDKNKIKDQATYQNPFLLSQGVDYVFVNGKPAVAEGKITGQLPGYTLRKS
ncbi:MAG: amidohydrolase family protein [Candidatus Doudnabacteria bacterium]|nr:amidohydrolase family protein [Candidatus Doudnabacteria bacterium]